MYGEERFDSDDLRSSGVSGGVLLTCGFCDRSTSNFGPGEVSMLLNALSKFMREIVCTLSFESDAVSVEDVRKEFHRHYEQKS